MQLLIRKARKFWIGVQMCLTEKQKEDMRLKMKGAITDLQSPWIDFDELAREEESKDAADTRFLASLQKN